jgi:glutaminyl-tRNA synthetase
VQHGLEAEVRLYDRLFSHPSPGALKDGRDYKEHLNPDSLRTVTGCVVEPDLGRAVPGERFQFEREGYFSLDEKLAGRGLLVFNRIVTLRDSWAKIEQQARG